MTARSRGMFWASSSVQRLPSRNSFPQRRANRAYSSALALRGAREDAQLGRAGARDRREAYPQPAAAILETFQLLTQFHKESGFSVRIQVTIPAVIGEIVIPDSFRNSR